MDLLARRHWIFDMDGTLTVPAHDFAAARRALSVPPGADILAHIAGLPAAAAQAAHAWLDGWERELAAAARPQDDARALLAALAGRGARLAVLTRNTVPVAWQTLRAAGLAHHFAPALVLGRESAPPKPAPDGVCRLLDHWGARPEDAVMVGDYVHDIGAGLAAGTATVFVQRRPGDQAPGAHRTVTDLRALLPAAEVRP